MTGEADAPARVTTKVFVPLTQWDLRSMLARGLAVPAGGLTEPTGELLLERPGYLPVVKGPAPEDYFGTNDENTVIKVLLELELELELSVDGANAFDRSDGAWVPLVAPLQHSPHLHFETQRDADECLAREFATVDLAAVTVTISPQLFGPTSGRRPVVTDDGAGLSSTRIAAGDRLAGALLVLCSEPAVSPADLWVRRDLVTTLLGMTVEGSVTSELRDLLTRAGRGSDTPDEAAFMRAAVEVVTGHSSDALTAPAKLLDEIEAAFTPAEGDDLCKALHAIRNILRGSRDMPAARPEHGSFTAKVLMLLLTRPGPAAIGTWLADRPEDHAAIAGASVLSGFVHGTAALPSEAKAAGHVAAIRRWQADWVNATSNTDVGPFLERALIEEGPRVVDGVGGEARLMWGDLELTSFRPPVDEVPLTPSGGDEQLSLEAGDSEASVLASLEAVLVTACAKPLSPEARSCAEACDRRGWGELVTTVLTIGPKGMSVRGKHASFPGLAKLGYELNEQVLRDRVLASRGDALDFARELGPPGAPRRRRPAKRTSKS